MNEQAKSRAGLQLDEILRQGRPPMLAHLGPIKWVVLAAAAFLVLWLLNPFGGRQNQVQYTTQPVTRGELVVLVTATGAVQPTNKVDVSSELSGTVRKVLVDYNSPVTAGQTLAELDTDKLNATVENSRAKLAAAKARVADAEATIVEKQREFMRKRELVEKKISSGRDLEVAEAAHDRALAALASAQADVNAAEAQLKLDMTNLSKACICSPISGIVLTRNVDPGQTVASSLQAPVLFSIAEDLKRMELQVDVDEADVGQVAKGQPATFTVDAYPGRIFPATIRDVRYASETIQGVVTYKAMLDIDNSDLLLRPGMTATAEIRVTEIKDALLVPNAALRFAPVQTETTEEGSFLRRLLPGPPRFRPPSERDGTGSSRTVWIIADGVPKAVKVEVGPSDGKNTEVRKGELTAGEHVIVDQTTAKN